MPRSWNPWWKQASAVQIKVKPEALEKFVQACSSLSKPIRALFKLVQVCSSQPKPVQASTSLSKLTQAYPSLFKPAQTLLLLALSEENMSIKHWIPELPPPLWLYLPTHYIEKTLISLPPSNFPMRYLLSYNRYSDSKARAATGLSLSKVSWSLLWTLLFQ